MVTKKNINRQSSHTSSISNVTIGSADNNNNNNNNNKNDNIASNNTDNSNGTTINNISRGISNNIPEVIDPGITIPIYEEDIKSISIESPQKIGSYRTRAGKFSNTLSNLLPSISAKLHHSRKNGSKNEDTPTTSNSNSTINLPSIILEQNTSSLPDNPVSMKEVPINDFRSGHLTPPNEPIQFPESSNHMLGIPRSSNDSFGLTLSNQLNPSTTNNINGNDKISRTRKNTVNSQITSMSSITQNQTIWTNDTNPGIHMIHPLHTSVIASTGKNYDNHNHINHNNSNNSNLHYDFAMPMASGTNVISNDNGLGNTLPIQPSSNQNKLWVNNSTTHRQRSISNASSIYIDAPLYGEQNLNRNAGSSTNYAPNINISHFNVNEPLESNIDLPFVCDDVDPSSLNWVSMDLTVPSINQITNLLPTNTISISNIFSLQRQQPNLSNAINLTSTSLATLCSKFGKVLSARTFNTLNIALVEFDSVESATRAMTSLQGKDVSVVGAPSEIYYAKILPMYNQVKSLGGTDQFMLNSKENNVHQSLLQEQLHSGAVTLQQNGNISIPVFNQYPYYIQQQQQQYANVNYNNYVHPSHNNIEKDSCPFILPPPPLKESKEKLQNIINTFDAKRDNKQIHSLLQSSYNFHGTSDTTNFGPLPDPLSNKDFDAPTLRELRKAIDNNSLSDLELEQLAICMFDELPELSSDYLGNTIVQKLFERSSDIIKDVMLRKTSLYLASMGVHKNGTWACQKIITMATTPRQRMFVIRGIYNYCVPLFTDQFGNYVIQCVLKYGYPWNSIIFESITANFWAIVQNRYGSRAVRACLEANDIIKTEQTLVLASIIVIYAKYLATNNNSTLLLTWFLDTCDLPNRYSILVSELLNNIVELCCHRLASLTILKILNYRGDSNARMDILEAIFDKLSSDEPPDTLRQILNDTNNGPTFIYKVLSISLLEEDIKAHIIKQVRKLVVDIPSAQQHRKLMEEIGFQPAQATIVNGQLKHRRSTSHIHNVENANHMRGVSMSSVLSSTSRHNTLMSNFSNNPLPIQQLQPVTSNGGVATNTTCYYNYPGGFPSNNYSGSNNHTYATHNGKDDLISQLDSLHLGNGTQVSLPQLSITHQNNNTNLLQPSSSSNQYLDFTR